MNFWLYCLGSLMRRQLFVIFMNDVFYDFLNKFVVVYLDESFKDLLSPLELVLFRLIENQLYVKKEKCEFGGTVVMFLGH